MKLTVLTLFPSIIEGYFQASIMKRAVEKGVIEYQVVDIRDYAFDKHKNCDDAPYGGGAGMVLKPEPVWNALKACNYKEKRVIYPSPSGTIFNQAAAQRLSQEPDLLFICGRYEGLDQRIIDLCVDEELSIGDYVLSSGELAALSIIDSVYRLVDGVISSESLDEESFGDGLLEYPHYTRPEEFESLRVPDILISGHHKNINSWRHEKRLEKTEINRPDLYEQYRKRKNGTI